MKTQEEIPTGTCKAAPISGTLHNKLLAAMMQAKAEVSDEERIEGMLRRLTPAPLSGATQYRVEQAVARTKEAVHSPYQKDKAKFSYLPLQKLAALIVLFCICLGVMSQFLMLNTDPESNERAAIGLASRRVFNVRPINEAKWGNSRLKSEYEVFYEDSFVYTDDDDMTIIVTVPNHATISMEVNSI